MTTLAGKPVVLTGATGGIGAATARRLASDGALVVVTDLAAEPCEALVADIVGAGGDAIAHVLDVGDESQWMALTARLRHLGVTPRGLVNNAGIASRGNVETETLGAWDRVLRVTQTGVFLGMKHLGPVLAGAGRASIVNICSIFGTVGGFGAEVSYHAAKGAVRTMTKNAALYWADKGVRVNSVHPGFIETETSKALWTGTERRARMIAGTPMARLGSPAEVAGVIAFLLSDDASYMTGSEVYVDGGWTAR
jgi:NAD(P)-dependent dehydrogenase (short-subunit alcohol dehydrogenase family)